MVNGVYFLEECYLNNQFGDNLFGNHNLQKKVVLTRKP